MTRESRFITKQRVKHDVNVIRQMMGTPFRRYHDDPLSQDEDRASYGRYLIY
jgi:hypothetical protein